MTDITNSTYKHINGKKFTVVDINSNDVMLKMNNSKATFKIGLDYFIGHTETSGGKSLGQRFTLVMK